MSIVHTVVHVFWYLLSHWSAKAIDFIIYWWTGCQSNNNSNKIDRVNVGQGLKQGIEFNISLIKSDGHCLPFNGLTMTNNNNN